MVFVKKWRYFNLQFLCKIGREKVFFEGSERKKAFLDQKNIGLKNYQNLNFFKSGQSMVFVKNGDFLIFSFHTKLKQVKKKCFSKDPKEKKPFYTIKNIGSKNHPKFSFFQRGQSMVFVKKWRFFNVQFLCKMDQEKMFF